MKIAIGSDHRGLEYKKRVINMLERSGFEIKDFGTYSADSVDYPDVARTVCEAVLKSGYDFGVLICGTGIGMSIAANKIKGIRAALCCDAFSAVRARQHNNANVLCLGAERGESGLEEILRSFFTTDFEGGRHQRRVDKMHEMEKADC